MKPDLNILYLCTGNSARSILAEAITNQWPLLPVAPGSIDVTAYSAGSDPTGRVNPQALNELIARDLSTDGLASKSWDEFSRPNAPEFEWVITLCDSAAAESCPVFPGSAKKIHWGLPDPASGDATFADIFDQLVNLIGGLMDGNPPDSAGR